MSKRGVRKLRLPGDELVRDACRRAEQLSRLCNATGIGAGELIPNTDPSTKDELLELAHRRDLAALLEDPDERPFIWD